MYYRLKTDHNNTFILTKTTHAFMHANQTTKPNPNRTLSVVGSESYERSLRRAFARAKVLAFFNPDLTHFITFTYKDNQLSADKALKDVKQFIKKQKEYYYQQNPTQSTKKSPFKYIYVFERQKRGAIHVHMIANGLFRTRINKNGYPELLYWPKGFSSVLSIKNADKSFKPYLYLFKYMAKAQRIGKSFIHTSRTFDKIQNVDYALYIDKLNGANLLFKEDYEIFIDDTKSRIIKEYYKTS